MNIVFTKKFLIAILFSVFLAGCATSSLSNTELTDAYDQYIDTENLQELEQIVSFRYDGWSALGQQHLIITAGFNRPYLIKLSQRCTDLRFANVIGIKNTINDRLQAKFDSISVPGSLAIDCYIDSIYELSRQQRDDLRKIGREEVDVAE